MNHIQKKPEKEAQLKKKCWQSIVCTMTQRPCCYTAQQFIVQFVFFFVVVSFSRVCFFFRRLLFTLWVLRCVLLRARLSLLLLVCWFVSYIFFLLLLSVLSFYDYFTARSTPAIPRGNNNNITMFFFFFILPFFLSSLFQKLKYTQCTHSVALYTMIHISIQHEYYMKSKWREREKKSHTIKNVHWNSHRLVGNSKLLRSQNIVCWNYWR